MTVRDTGLHVCNMRQNKRREPAVTPRWIAAAWVAAGATALGQGSAQAQTPPTPWKPQAPQYIQCPAPGQPLIRIPEIVAQEGIPAGRLRGTVLLNNGVQRLYLGANDTTQCLPQDVRQFSGWMSIGTGTKAVLPAYQGAIPPGYPGYVPPTPAPPNGVLDPVPGPTLRAKVGDIVQLAFLNQIGTGPYWDSIDRGEKGQGCDESTGAQQYPGLDVFPDCFHGSSTGNIHFHGTHTNPGSTGDNVLIEVRPALRDKGKLIPDPITKPSFEKFFAACENELNKSVLSQWPRSWNDLPPQWVTNQTDLLNRYDANPAIKNKLGPIDAAQRAAGAWPQYYIGAYPYCFRLPRYAARNWPPGGARTPSHVATTQSRALQMGQSPGTHWYHAHKHGSTTINVANGMTGAFIIEGGYDDMLNTFYNHGWTGPQPWARAQPVLVVNQLGVSPNLFGGGVGGGAPFSINGRFQPMLTMQPGQVQLWRIANTSSRGSVFMTGFAPAGATAAASPQTFAWKQIAQDGVQFTGGNYAASQNPTLTISPGGRADLLVQAPSEPGQYILFAAQVRSNCETLAAAPTIPTVAPPPPKAPYPSPICAVQTATPFLQVTVTGAAATGNQALFIPPATVDLAFPPFLADITDSEVRGTKILAFESTPTGGSPGAKHSIDGRQFDGNVGEVVLLNNVEEWTIVNKTVNGGLQTINGAPKVVTTDPPGVVDHPFHIHINPFQITELFDPNEVLPGTTTYKYIFEGQPAPGQCLLDITKPSSWKPCSNPPSTTGRVWWDVFPIPTGRAVFLNNNTQMVVVPGYFKMRSRFVDFTGQYVLHCHILAHEDRGMMTIVEVVPLTTPYSHQ
jgi:FtsP/CotA-like multicopper oxidase with cupredoxin domain